ncbi:stabilin-1-like [Xenia sp. Carnegie-2017]|uniref:stabilin-1-like n=1 Tax=Xenia sp. Carnegie-2017 TaxID=2897299 RepID=UPI001F037BDD|nr:stabilin-1-like [Xenia sp. Carnegie-2017]
MMEFFLKDDFFKSVVLTTVCIVFVLFSFPAQHLALKTYEAQCFNAQDREAFAISINSPQVIKTVTVRTVNDTTAVKQRFHIDYFHPKNKYWTSYQEDRRTMFYTFAVPKKYQVVKLADPIVAKSIRISLQSTAPTWLGEICVQINVWRKRIFGRRVVSCEKGYYGDGQFCIDINECADNTGNFCPPHQDCIDYPGSFSCPGTCLEDKLPNNVSGVCEDRCHHKGYLCHRNARCLYGKCVCNSGYHGDGHYCLDSCTSNGLVCDSNAICTDGKCKCRDDYNGNGQICQAICHFNLKLCHPKAVCHMNTCKCKPGYVGDGLFKCIFSRKLYEMEIKKQKIERKRVDIVDSDVLEVLHEFQRLRSILNT